jgi:hypothetical protein
MYTWSFKIEESFLTKMILEGFMITLKVHLNFLIISSITIE